MEQTFGARSGIIEDIQSRALSSDQSSPAANVQVKGKGETEKPYIERGRL